MMVVTNLFLVIGLTMFLFTLILLSARRKSAVTYWLAGYVFSVGYIWAYFGMYRVNQMAGASWLIYSDLFMEALAGPALFRYTASLVGREPPRGAVRRFLPLMPAAACLAYLAFCQPGLRLPPESLAGRDPDYFWSPLLAAVNMADDCWFFANVAASCAVVGKAWAAGSQRFRKSFRGIVAYYFIGVSTIVGFAVGHSLKNDDILGISVLANGINTTFLFFLCNRNPEFMLKPLRSPAPGAAPPPAPARGLDTDRLRRELSRLIEVEGAYRDPDLSLQSLSNRLGIQHHQLSQFLNEHLGMNFRSFINQSRLEEAKRLLASDERMSVLDIAFGVGFNSKSAFHSVFLKGTGLSPSEFRKMARKSPEIVQQDDVGQPSR